jgi:hypothetical protein
LSRQLNTAGRSTDLKLIAAKWFHWNDIGMIPKYGSDTMMSLAAQFV